MDWISVEDRLPDGDWVDNLIVASKRWGVLAGEFKRTFGDSWEFGREGEIIPEVTHWMPMPEGPR